MSDSLGGVWWKKNTGSFRMRRAITRPRRYNKCRGRGDGLLQGKDGRMRSNYSVRDSSMLVWLKRTTRMVWCNTVVAHYTDLLEASRSCFFWGGGTESNLDDGGRSGGEQVPRQ